jgi:hypothetical protein
MRTPMLELFNNRKGIYMNKLIASLIVGAFSAAAFATTPVAAKTEATPAMKTETKKVMKEKKVAVKADAAKKIEATAPAAPAIK